MDDKIYLSVIKGIGYIKSWMKLADVLPGQEKKGCFKFHRLQVTKLMGDNFPRTLPRLSLLFGGT